MVKLDIVMVQPAVSFDDKFEVDSGVLIPDKQVHQVNILRTTLTFNIP